MPDVIEPCRAQWRPIDGYSLAQHRDGGWHQCIESAADHSGDHACACGARTQPLA